MAALPKVGPAVPPTMEEEQHPSPVTALREGGEDLPETLFCELPDSWRPDYKLRVHRFIVEYLHDFNGERAALAAWPEGQTRAHIRAFTCLRDPNIKLAIANELRRRAAFKMLDEGSLLHRLAEFIYNDDRVRPETQLKATELAMKFRGMLKESSTTVNVLVGLAERLAEAKEAIECEEVEK